MASSYYRVVPFFLWYPHCLALQPVRVVKYWPGAMIWLLSKTSFLEQEKGVISAIFPKAEFSLKQIIQSDQPKVCSFPYNLEQCIRIKLSVYQKF